MGFHNGQYGNWCSKGSLSQYDEVYYCYMGSDREFPRDSEIPIELVRQGAKEFLENGGECPGCVAWQARVVLEIE